MATCRVAFVAPLAIAIVDTIGATTGVVTNIATTAVCVGFAGGGCVDHALATFALKALTTHSVVGANGVALASIAREAVGTVVIGRAGSRWNLETLTSGGVAFVATLAVAIVVTVGSTAAVVADITAATVCVGLAGGGCVGDALAAFALKVLSTLLVGGARSQAFLARTCEPVGAVVVCFASACRQHHTFAGGGVALVACLAIAIVVASGAAAIVVTVEAILAVFVGCAEARWWLTAVVAGANLPCRTGDTHSPLVAGSCQLAGFEFAVVATFLVVGADTLALARCNILRHHTAVRAVGSDCIGEAPLGVERAVEDLVSCAFAGTLGAQVGAAAAFAVATGLVGGTSFGRSPLPTLLGVLLTSLNASAGTASVTLLASVVARNRAFANVADAIAGACCAGSPNPATLGILYARLCFVGAVAANVSLRASVVAGCGALAVLTNAVVGACCAGSPV